MPHSAILADLTTRGHDVHPLTRPGPPGVPRLTTRMPDLVCIQCGLRVVIPATPPFSLPHGAAQHARWDFGLIPTDLIAFAPGLYLSAAMLRAVPFTAPLSSLAAWPSDLPPEDFLDCPGAPPSGYLGRLIASRERTLRFTGVKLARLTRDRAWHDIVTTIEGDPEEDILTRLEAAAYLASVWGQDPAVLFEPYLCDADPQIQLEAVLALGDAGEDASDLLAAITDPPALRDAAAWVLDPD